MKKGLVGLVCRGSGVEGWMDTDGQTDRQTDEPTTPPPPHHPKQPQGTDGRTDREGKGREWRDR